MPIAAIPTLVTLLLRLGPWILGWLIVTEVQEISEDITHPGEGGGFGSFFLGLGVLGTVAVVGLGAYLLFGMKRGN